MLDVNTKSVIAAFPGSHTFTGSVDRESFACFPLALTAFEKFLNLDDRKDCPITSFIELHFTAALQQTALLNALRRVVHRHPLLASTLSTQNGEFVWYYDPNFEPTLRDPVLDPPLESGKNFLDPSSKPFDLTSEPGCRYWYHDKTEGGSRLLIQLHHACCDGVGLRQVLIDILSDYAENVGPETREAESVAR